MGGSRVSDPHRLFEVLESPRNVALLDSFRPRVHWEVLKSLTLYISYITCCEVSVSLRSELSLHSVHKKLVLRD